MRVTWLTHNYPRDPADLAGAFLHPLAAGLARRGLTVTVIAPSDGGRGGEEMRDGVRIRRVRYASAAGERYAYRGTMLSAVRSPGGLLALAGLFRALRRAAQGAEGDLVHAHWWVPAGLAAPVGPPLMVTLHGTDAALLERWRAVRWPARRLFRRAQLITAVSQAVAGTVARTAGGRAARIEVQPMPVDTTDWGWSVSGGGLLVVARLTAQKRVDLVIRAVAALAAAGRAVTCTIVGDGPARPALESLVGTLGLTGQVVFTGLLPFREVRNRLEVADVAVQPSRGEGFGLAAAEALMCGVPVVACTDGGGLLDVVPPGGAGRVVPPEPAALAEALLALLEAPGAREAARLAGAAWRERLAPDRVAERFAGWYEELLDA